VILSWTSGKVDCGGVLADLFASAWTLTTCACGWAMSRRGGESAYRRIYRLWSCDDEGEYTIIGSRSTR
jgi:hypothetical protein